jgi:hypothetical protein
MTKRENPENIGNEAEMNEHNLGGTKDIISDMEEKNQDIPESEKSDNMEIHHPHKKHHHRKAKEYISEFVMLFIAITAGFFAENLREMYVENHREHQYIATLIKDLEADTASIKNTIVVNEKQIKGLDSLLNLMVISDKSISEEKLYYYIHYLNSLSGFSPREMTIMQLRNSGGLRLISNKSTSDSIVTYYTNFESHEEQMKYSLEFQRTTMELEMRLLDFKLYNNGKFKTIAYSEDFKELYNRSLVFISLLINEVKWLKDYQKQSLSLLNFLKKEYKL